jgi:hypothetical protein
MKRQVTIRSNKGYMEQKEAGTKRKNEATRKTRKYREAETIKGDRGAISGNREQ